MIAGRGAWSPNLQSRLFPQHRRSPCFQLSIGLFPVSGSFPCEAIRSGKAGLASLSGRPPSLVQGSERRRGAQNPSLPAPLPSLRPGACLHARSSLVQSKKASLDCGQSLGPGIFPVPARPKTCSVTLSMLINFPEPHFLHLSRPLTDSNSRGICNLKSQIRKYF